MEPLEFDEDAAPGSDRAFDLRGFLSAAVAVAKARLGASETRKKTVSRAWDALAGQTMPAETTDSAASVDAIVDAMADAVGSEAPMTLLVTGEAAPAALAVALSAARRLARRGRAALLDVGATQPWLTDVMDQGPENAGALFGLSDVLDGRASFDQALYRDLSTRLDILPAGSGKIYEEMLAPALESLAQTYSYIVVHASDWRASPGCAAIGAANAAIVCAPAPRIEAARQRLRDALADLTVLTEGVAVSSGRSRVERAWRNVA